MEGNSQSEHRGGSKADTGPRYRPLVYVLFVEVVDIVLDRYFGATLFSLSGSVAIRGYR